MSHIFCWLGLVCAVVCTVQRLMMPVHWFHNLFGFLVTVGLAIGVAALSMFLFSKIGWVPN